MRMGCQEPHHGTSSERQTRYTAIIQAPPDTSIPNLHPRSGLLAFTTTISALSNPSDSDPRTAMQIHHITGNFHPSQLHGVSADLENTLASISACLLLHMVRRCHMRDRRFLPELDFSTFSLHVNRAANHDSQRQCTALHGSTFFSTSIVLQVENTRLSEKHRPAR